MTLFDKLQQTLPGLNTVQSTGRVLRITGSLIEASGPSAGVGEMCRIATGEGLEPCLAEVIAFHGSNILLMPLKTIAGIAPGAQVETVGNQSAIPVGEALRGRILNALCEPIDGAGPVVGTEMRTVVSSPPAPLSRRPVSRALETGVRAIDALATLGQGQRVGIMAGSGVGKSTLLGMIARRAKADINVIALIGERGREVAEFIQRDLGPEGLARSVVIVVTSDEMPLLRVKGALVATTVAEYFRDQGASVILMMDSLTRVAMAQREIGLAIGEPPTTRGYTPSTFSLLPQILERAGNSDSGSITGIYTILVEGDDFNEPVSDTARGILDGHIVLSRRLAARGHFPSIDVLHSLSRVMPSVVNADHLAAAQTLRDYLATYAESEDLVSIGAYQKGANPRLDRVLERMDAINAFLCQDVQEHTGFAETIKVLKMLGAES